MLLKESINHPKEAFCIENFPVQNNLKKFLRPQLGKFFQIPTEIEIEQYPPVEETLNKIYCHQILRNNSTDNLKSKSFRFKLRKYFQIDQNVKRQNAIKRIKELKNIENSNILVPEIRKLIGDKRRTNLDFDKLRSLSQTVKGNHKAIKEEAKLFSNDIIQSKMKDWKNSLQTSKNYFDKPSFYLINSRYGKTQSDITSKENIFFPIITYNAIKPTIETNFFSTKNVENLMPYTNRSEHDPSHLTIGKIKKTQINFLNKCLKIPFPKT